MSAARELRAAVRGQVTAEGQPGVKLDRADLAEATVLNFDPSLAETGWSVLVHTEAELALVMAGSVKWTKGLDSREWRAAAGDHLYEALVPLLRSIARDYPGIEAVIEAPPAGKGARSAKMQRTDSTEAAMNRIRSACLAVRVPIRPMVDIQRHKHLITGDRGAEKEVMRACLALLGQSLPIRDHRLATNDNIRDSVCVGIADLYWRNRDE